MRARTAAAIAAALALTTAQLWLANRGNERAGGATGAARDETASHAALPGVAAPHPHGAVARAEGAEAPAPTTGDHRPASLRATRPDGGLAVDARGRFRPTIDARRLFDYYLTASGEESPAQIEARIRAAIDRRLQGDAARSAHEVLGRYLAYRERAAALADSGLGEATPKARLAALYALRRETLGAEVADAFFAAEEAVDRAAIALASADGTDPAQRRAAAADALPAGELEVRREALLPIDLRRAEAELTANGGSAGAVQALRERSVGADAAARLAALDLARAEWRARLDAYRAARDAIAADPSLTPAARATAIETLRNQRFAGPERLRVAALDTLP